MALPSPVELFALNLSVLQVYGLFFLLGSFAVASLSDLKHMAAQKEFMDVWLVFAGVMAALDFWRAGFQPDPTLLLKWGLILALSLLSWHRIGVVFRLARADVAAMAAAASLLQPGAIVLFWLLMKGLSLPLGRGLRKGDAYPFLPVVALATVALLALAWWLAGAVLPPSPAPAWVGRGL
ncbi:MAG TPA: hypothetical protein VGR28_07135 [Candidatus Thermoplasmatota archaeon]|nr:hypothetical protein [Candidatus Thermoplasmatota archaeon]